MLSSIHKTAEAIATWAMDKVAPTLRYSFRLIDTPLRRMISSHITIAKEPSGKKCGPRLLSMMLLKIRLVKVGPVTAAW